MSDLLLLNEALIGPSFNMIESYDDQKNLYLDGIMMQAGIKNRNKRTYRLDELSNNVTNLQEQISNNNLMGELDHPQSVIVNLDRVSHMITSLKMIGNDGYGKAKIISKTPCGSIAKALVESGAKLGFSTRGTGSVDNDGNVSNCMILTVDIVGVPSAPGAVPKPIYESVGNAHNGNEILTLAECVQHDDTAQKYLQKEILKFLKTQIFMHK